MNHEQLRADLKRSEEIRTRVYDDATGKPIVTGTLVHGHPTVGVGRRIDLPLSDAAITFLLEEDIASAMDDLDRELPWWTLLSEPAQRALVELTFTMGITGLLKLTRMLTALKNRQLHDAARALEGYLWTKQVHQVRSKRVCDQLRTPTTEAE